MLASPQVCEIPEWYEAIYAYVRGVPEGKVVTYGQVADETPGITVTPRQVGAALRYVPADVPWHRVVGAGGWLPIAKRSTELKLLQRRLLAQEGVFFQPGDGVRVDMSRSQWLAQTSLS